ncbi:DUF1540 domain-containing protein [Alicyclobacillus acidocaldarius]|uniref:DUF1540 domain-containing protein n=1 Tax=Alicyclobacillus acidocaldarius subsp. acidocaldarius (strain ATCC 27009 / DSM 446 / BCRC 14685 / JCM 5260 / KCTC 1825 / NBRC 15652 / NCIMB 11725 / NRRL B-14509 / 104-IA) TaxID=521098 RepID=C8WR36_ALIAD|nr:DUF1540 domain-containing protein [Alicyclobacillus acidocaldarius]ACV59205.1 protein of unknown function DUF1540 [Alicyclobacillus acidocaldarius subsp. acidocaldarius DSM 446]
MKVDVKCTVANCLFWHEGNECAAPSIMVSVSRRGETSFREEFGREFAVAERESHARSSMETCCETFKPRHRSNP